MQFDQVALLYGGQSSEHEISLLSAANVYQALTVNHTVAPIFISKSGSWHHNPEPLFNAKDSQGEPVYIRPGAPAPLQTGQMELPVAVIFPILHGLNGEDGSLQGLFQMLGMPVVGSGLAGSAVCMDKELMKRLLRDAGMPIASFLCYSNREEAMACSQSILKELGLPLFAKPCNAGSSVGISRVKKPEDFADALDLAFQHDSKIILESAVTGREVECAVLGNSELQASPVGEIRLKTDFYDYDTKYNNAEAAELDIPARLTEPEIKAVQEVSLQAYRSLMCRGMARVDSFLLPDGRVIINELNTLPGFTNISMYPALWKAGGLATADLVSKLVVLAKEAATQEGKKHG